MIIQPKSLIIAAFLAATPIAVGAIAALTGIAAAPAEAVDVIGFDRKWLLSVDEARAVIANGALVLDARNAALRAQAPIRNAGILRVADLAGSDAEVTTRLRNLGLNRGEPVIVLGDPAHGLGEDATLVLALRSLGHQRVAMVDGGLPALLAAGLPTVQAPFGLGNFEIAHNDSWSLQAAHASVRDFQLVESDLSPELLTPDGRIKSADQIAAILAAKGIDRDARIATAGARSAWLATILLDQGYDARQVVGSEEALTAAN
jgi:thiosulfate/3-mercaptopyruvate sulfurtransferase